jgi:hypothetical protein
MRSADNKLFNLASSIRINHRQTIADLNNISSWLMFARVCLSHTCIWWNLQIRCYLLSNRDAHSWITCVKYDMQYTIARRDLQRDIAWLAGFIARKPQECMYIWFCIFQPCCSFEAGIFARLPCHNSSQPCNFRRILLIFFFIANLGAKTMP